MSRPIIEVKNISKCYQLGAIGATRLRDDLERVWDRWTGKAARADESEFWALRDVSFEVQPGEVVGIIGRNGAGKSTLLKILSRITEPTSGEIVMRGRVASLLEVGTGFVGDLSGRDNIFLNGAILGMSRAEIRKKFDEIVAFSEVEKFIDTPVKRYSSGMFVRLAFAVAAHLEPEILIIDEVLAVGDVSFQQKCLGKMQDVSVKEGRTVLFVSHQMGAVLQMCTKGILLTRGTVTFAGNTKRAVDGYMNQGAIDNYGAFVADSISTTKEIVITKAETWNEKEEPTLRFTHDELISVAITCKVNRWVSGAEIRFVLKDSALRPVFTTDTEITARDVGQSDTFDAVASIPASFLRPGKFTFTLATFIPDVLIIDLVNDAFSVTVIDGGSKYAASEGMDYGCVFAPCAWSLRPHSPAQRNSDEARSLEEVRPATTGA